MAAGKTILILGGGIGGVVAASRLRQGLSSEHRVILVERETDHVFCPSFLWLMTGQRTAEEISRPVAALAKHGIEVIRGNIDSINPEKRTIQVNGKEIAGDYLVIALGVDLAPETVPGLVQTGHNLYALAGAEALRDARLKVKQGRIAVLVRHAFQMSCSAQRSRHAAGI